MKFDDSIWSSAFECLVFPAAGGVPLFAMATAGVDIMQLRKMTTVKRRQGSGSKRSKRPRIARLECRRTTRFPLETSECRRSQELDWCSENF
jgi:hypothetical protein